MRLGKEDKEVLVFPGFLVVTVFLLISIFSINQRGKSIVESPRLLPMIVVGCMFLICGGGLTRSLRAHGRPTLAKVGGSLRACAADPQVRRILLSMLIVAVYVFVGIPFIGFYLSSFLLICGITLFYVRSIKPVYAVLVSLALTGLLYLIFFVAFNLRLQ